MGGDVAKKTIQTFTTIHHLLEDVDVDETLHIREQFKSLLDSLKHLSTLRENFPKDDIEAISFSKLTESHYQRLGVVTPKVIQADMAYSFVAARLAAGIATDSADVVMSQSILEPFWDQHYQRMSSTIKRIRSDGGNLPEAQARMIIDQYAIMNMELLDNRAIALFFTEFVISKGDMGPAEVVVRKLDGSFYRTFVTGRADYLFLISVPVSNEEINACKALPPFTTKFAFMREYTQTRSRFSVKAETRACRSSLSGSSWKKLVRNLKTLRLCG
ncbi:hypothetical protein BDN72DRAFT_906499 [Pluteus cervinus]|uniref:Uncharacterized protein n=1 Tax=Pluteus cervinus TaxID=181527 RepID=A0ACD2ZZ99_9AGAR|nr:hypothetical protein BDN72DRAFT_906499 [Pluteus cervinus]